MNLVVNNTRSSQSWKMPFNRSYPRAAMYWLGVLAAMLMMRDINRFHAGDLVQLAVFTPLAVWVLAELSRQLRRHANSVSVAMAPDLEFSSRGMLALHAIRSLLIVTELATALAMAAMVVYVVRHF
ncbi:MAG TPA: hypothetical protein VG962_13160 [Steroidobacteraceae bacterium]|jgi:hypothetical protein|nr:hypothetical protein [Steroidobacteraceae bacterium]